MNSSVFNTVYVGNIGASGEPGMFNLIPDKSFRINYLAKDGSYDTVTIDVPTLDSAISKIPDLVKVNYHIEG